MMAGRIQDADSYNRIFIIGAHDYKPDEIREAFEKFGTVTDVYIPRDKTTRESKGIVYVSFSKASEAALAIEEMNGKGLFNDDNSRPLKVVLASSKSQGSVRDPNEDVKMLRLFIMIPSSFSEKDVEEEFRQYGHIDSVRIVKGRRANDGRYFAFVKFARAYDAAVALESCASHFKAVFAETPKPKGFASQHGGSDYHSQQQSGGYGYGAGSRDFGMSRSIGPMSYEPMSMRPPAMDVRPDLAAATLELLHNYSSQRQTIVEAMFPSCVSYEHVNRLFDIIPGLEGCKYDQASGRASAKYSTSQAAAYAQDKLDGLEYPLGYRISVQLMKDNMSGLSMYDSGMGGLPQAADSLSNVKTLVDSIQKATALLQQVQQVGGSSLLPAGGVGGGSLLGNMALGSGPSYGSGSGMGLSGYGGNAGGYNSKSSRSYCNVALPDKRPLAPRDSNIVQRLFIVSQPDTFDDAILEDCFCRFGNLIGAYFMPGKKFGYVKYASSDSAREAMDVMHGQTVCGNRLKVLPAEPQRRRPDESAKRDRSSGDRHSRSYDDDRSSSPKSKFSRFD